MSHIFTPEEIAYAQAIHREKGRTFYFGTMFFPKDIREAIHVLYAFVRVPDDYVDEPEDKDEEMIRKKIYAWRDQWHKDFLRGESEDIVLHMSIKLFNAYHIPFQYSLDFLDAMIADTRKYRYATYEELDAYMWGSASVVGIMLTHICGYTGGMETVDKAHLLGDAFQITNFLRDIGEDYRDRARIYMPLDELHMHGVSESDIQTSALTPQFITFMTFQIARNRDMYASAEKGIPYLAHPRVRLGVLLASRLYARILHKIEVQGYDVFTKRAFTTFAEKILIALPIIVRWIFTDAWRGQTVVPETGASAQGGVQSNKRAGMQTGAQMNVQADARTGAQEHVLTHTRMNTETKDVQNTR